MRRPSWGRRLGSAVVLLGALGIAPAALAAEPPAATHRVVATHASHGAPAAAQPGHARRPIFLGLLAAAFLLIGALVGANDRPDGDPPKS